MANHEIDKEYSEELRKIETTDPVHADTLNPLYGQLINNDAFLKDEVDSKETPTGAQQKADNAEDNAKQYADQAAQAAEQNANQYTDEQVGNIEVPVTSVNNKTGDVTVTKEDVGLGKVINELQASKTEHDQLAADFTAHQAETMQYGPIEMTVGEGGDYQTINEALEYLSKKYPSYVEGENRTKAIIKLLSGFEMREQIIVEGLNLSWIELTSEDDEVFIIREELTKKVTLLGGTDIFPAFAATDGGFLPIFNCLFHMDETGEEDNRKGIACVRNSRAVVLEGAGMIGSHDNIYAHSSSVIEAYGAIATDAIRYGIAAYQSSTINANSAIVTNAGGGGIYAIQSSTINANGAIATNAGGDGALSAQGSTINLYDADVSGARGYGVHAQTGSKIIAYNADARKSEGEDSESDIVVQFGGGVISVSANTQGGTSQAVNELTGNGIIFLT